MKKAIRSKIVTEDLNVGLNKVEIQRNKSLYEGMQVNASSLLGLLVVKTKADLLALREELLITKSVFVQDDQTIYTYDKPTKQWITDYNGLRVIDTTADLANIPNSYKLAYNLQDGLFYSKQGDEPWLANGTMLMVVENGENLDTLPDGITIVIDKSTGELYHKTPANTWEQIVFDTEGDPVVVVDTVDLLPKNPTITTAVVRDIKRGGWFMYDASKANTNDNGLIFNGWVRQFSGPVSAYWYDAKGDGITDDSAALNSAFKNASVYLPKGVYKCLGPITVINNLELLGNGSELKFESVGGLAFTGGIANAPLPVGAIAKYSLTISCDNRGFSTGDYILLVDTNKMFGKLSIAPAQVIKIAGLDGSLGLKLKDNVLTTYKNANVYKLLPIKINLSDLVISVATSSQEALICTNVVDSTLTNVKIVNTGNNTVELNTCGNFKFVSSELYSTRKNCSLAKCSNIKFINSLLSGTTNIEVESSECITTSIGVYSSTFVASTSSILTNGSSINLIIKDSTINGQIIASGQDLLIDSSTILSNTSCVKFTKIVGGEFKFLNSKFIALSKSLVNSFITYSDSKTITSDSITQVDYVEYNITDCVFEDTQESSIALLEAIGINKPNEVVKSSVYVNNVVYKGKGTKLESAVRLLGAFSNVYLLGINTPSAICSLKNMSTNNSSVISQWTNKYVDIDAFYTDAIYLSSGKYGYNLTPEYSELSKSSSQGYYLVIESSTKLFTDCQAHGKDVLFTQKGDDSSIQGKLIEYVINSKRVLDVTYASAGAPSKTTVTDLYTKLRGPIRIINKNVNGGVL